jgi:exopolyphosphatase/guanosine-5'-triphosphate,3'-diphosphate pyrophosphatase
MSGSGGAAGGARRVAAVDCGTNSVRLLVADVDPSAGTLVDVEREMRITRLGQGVDRTGVLAADAVERTLDVLRGYAALIAEHGAAGVRMCATSATRDAANAAEFTAAVTDILGVAPEVITGAEEAGLSFAGATRELLAPGGPPPPFLVVDIGGGSTEFVLGSATVDAARSVDMGCVRMTERHLAAAGGVPTAAQVSAARDDIRRAIADAGRTVPLDRARTLVGVAGSVTTVAAIALGLTEYTPSAIHHSSISAATVREVAQRLLSLDHDARAAIPAIHPGRVDVIGAGALVLDTIMAETGATEVVVSEHDILDGIAWSARARLGDA